MKKIYSIFASSMALLISIPSALAHCPLCTIAAGAGIGVARFYGIDDSIVGLFLGAFIVSTALWFNRWLKTKIDMPLQKFLMVFASFLLFIAPLYLAGIINSFEAVKAVPSLSMLGLNVLGIDKLLFGSIIGTLFVFVSFNLSDHIKRKNNKVLFPYQGISFMILTLLILSEIFWIILK